MLKAILGLFLLLLIFPALLSDAQLVEIRLLPGFPVYQLPLGGAMFVFVGYGMLCTMLISILDRAKLAREKKKLAQENKKLTKELQALRDLMITEKDPG